MAYTEFALSKPNKDDLIRIELDIKKKRYNKLEADLKISKSVTDAMENHIVVLEQKYWNNEQYSRRECLKISGITSDTDTGENGTEGF